MLADLVPKSDPGQPRQLFETAAGRGQARAAYALAAMSATSEPPDPVAARRWLTRAAELGDPVARDMLQRGMLPLLASVQESLADEGTRRIEFWRAARRGDLATWRPWRRRSA